MTDTLVSYGETFAIGTPQADEIESVVLLKTPSAQHVNDSDGEVSALPASSPAAPLPSPALPLAAIGTAGAATLTVRRFFRK